jgi:hypothetical protein
VRYAEEARTLWQTAVPPRGQAATIQGELLRAVERLHDEAQRNGNINWETGYEIFIVYLRRHLLSAPQFTTTTRQEIEADLNRLSEFEYPETSDAPYDRLSDRVIKWCHAHPQPLPHISDPTLHLEAGRLPVRCTRPWLPTHSHAASGAVCVSDVPMYDRRPRS